MKMLVLPPHPPPGNLASDDEKRCWGSTSSLQVASLFPGCVPALEQRRSLPNPAKPAARLSLLHAVEARVSRVWPWDKRHAGRPLPAVSIRLAWWARKKTTFSLLSSSKGSEGCLRSRACVSQKLDGVVRIRPPCRGLMQWIARVVARVQPGEPGQLGSGSRK